MPLQRPFRGLADHLGVYSGGSLNFDLVNAVGIGINPEDFINPIQSVFTSGTLTAARQIATHAAVPQGEMWRVRYWGLRALDAASSSLWSPVWSDDGARFFGLNQEDSGFETPAAAGQRAHLGMLFNGQEGFVMFPAEQLGWDLRKSPGATAAVFTTVIRYQRIKI